MKGPPRPFLMFSGERYGRAEEAIGFYISALPDSRIVSVDRYGPGGNEREGTVRLAHFVLAGREFMAIDSVMDHGFNFTPSVSFFLTAGDEDEFAALADAMAADGQMLMPPDDYGFSRRFCWFNDRFGVSWQLNLE